MVDKIRGGMPYEEEKKNRDTGEMQTKCAKSEFFFKGYRYYMCLGLLIFFHMYLYLYSDSYFTHKKSLLYFIFSFFYE